MRLQWEQCSHSALMVGVMPGRKTVDSALAVIDVTPWWVECSAFNITSRREGVEGLKIYCLVWFSILLGTYNHVMAPCHWFLYWDRLQDTKGDVLIKANLYFLLSVKWHSDWCVVGHQHCIWVHHELQWDAIHEGEPLVSTCAGPVMVEEPFL